MKLLREMLGWDLGSLWAGRGVVGDRGRRGEAERANLPERLRGIGWF